MQYGQGPEFETEHEVEAFFVLCQNEDGDWEEDDAFLERRDAELYARSQLTGPWQVVSGYTTSPRLVEQTRRGGREAEACFRYHHRKDAALMEL